MSQPPQSFWRRNIINISAIVALVFGIAAAVVGLLVSYALGGLLGLIAFFLGKVSRDLSKSLRESQALGMAAMVLGGIGVAMSAVGGLANLSD